MKYIGSEFDLLFSSVKPIALAKVLEQSKMKYGYNKDTKIYSVKFYIKKRKGVKSERTLTMRVSPKFLEYSLSDSKGNVLEVMRQDKAGLKFLDFKKKKKAE